MTLTRHENGAGATPSCSVGAPISYDRRRRRQQNVGGGGAAAHSSTWNHPHLKG